MDKKLVEKFFVSQTTPGETEKVLAWFDTPEGKQYLEERLDIDYDLMDRKELRERVPEVDSERLYQSIQKRTTPERGVIIRKTDWTGNAFKAAAALLVIALTSVFYIINYTEQVEEVVEREPIHIQTEEEQHREIRLSDGSVVRLNNNSEIVISENFLQGSREIELTGEAYFDVAHDPKQPFIVHANQSTIRVLGTSFNIKSVPGQDNVQVAVVEGKVSFTNTKANLEQERLSVVLSKGQYGYMDINRRTILVDDLAVENYLAWKNKRFVFNKLTLQQVCTQMNRIYYVRCVFDDVEIKNLQLTANFSNESLEKTLSVISLSLNIEYEKEIGRVHWSYPNKQENQKSKEK